MRKFIASAAIVSLAFGTFSCTQPKINQNMELKTKSDEFSYCIGMDMGMNFQDNNLDSINVDALMAGLSSVLDGKDTKFTRTESQTIVREYLQKRAEEQAAKKQGEGKEFLNTNASKEGITVTESGLQYEVINEGTGKKPTASDVVKVHYTGTLIDGTVFDSSVQRGEPAVFPVNGVIKGWTEALQLMAVGSKWKLYIPSELAYGQRGAGNLIGPGETLIFEVELLEVK